MTDPRLSTVYDYSNLRLHPDGTRVYQKSSNLRPGLIKVTAQDPRSNWIARDAGGSGIIRKFRKRERVKDTGKDVEEEKDVDLPSQNEGDGELGAESSEEATASEDDCKKRKPEKRFDGRQPKRQKFAKDYRYLDSEALSLNSVETDGSPSMSISGHGFSEPSADLLKCIHRFASEFYTERGQLLNTSREYRKKRKEQRLAKREKLIRGKAKEASNSGSNSDSSKAEGNSFHQGTDNSDEDDDDEEGESGNSESSDDDEDIKLPEEGTQKGKGSAKPKPEKRRRPRLAEKLHTDMYKMFDGSAIMALGMLVQEQIAQMLNPDIPESWTEEMEKVYGGATAEQEKNNDTSSDEQEENEQENLLEEETRNIQTIASSMHSALQGEVSNEDGDDTTYSEVES